MTLEEFNRKTKERHVMALGDGKAATVGGMVVENATSAPAPAPVSLAVTADEPESEPSEQMTTSTAAVAGVAVVAPAIVAAFITRHRFWEGKLAEAKAAGPEQEPMVEAAVESLKRIAHEAAAAGVNLAEALATPAVSPAATVSGGSKKKSGGKSKTPRSVLEKEAAANHKAGKLAEQAAANPQTGATKAAVATVKKDKTLRPCLDGCGAMVPGNFQMGHDAKLKSLLLKVERGELPIESVPEIVQGIVKLKKGPEEELKNAQGVTTGKVQTYVLLAAPVKFHGRPEIQHTQREQ